MPVDPWLMRPENIRRYYERLGLEYVEQDETGLAQAIDVECEAASRRPAKGSDAAKAKMAKVREAKERKHVQSEDDE